jgi:uncharacterized metal-binding protein YceD (DUF177 family)
MTVDFRKVTKTPLEFSLENKNVIFKGSLEYIKGSIILLKATLTGSIELDCYLCAESFSLMVDEVVEFYIHNGVYDGMDEEYDIVESLDGKINLEELLNSEIELIKSGYNSCEKCNQE